MLDALRVVISKAKELLKLLYHSRFWLGTYGLNHVKVCAQTTSFDNMHQVLNQCLSKEALLMFSIQPFSMQFFEYILQVLHVLLDSGAKYKDVIQVYSHIAGKV